MIITGVNNSDNFSFDQLHHAVISISAMYINIILTYEILD